MFKAIGITLFESEYFGGEKICSDGIAPVLRANKVCAGVIEIMKFDEINRIGGMYGQATRWGVYANDGIAPTLTATMGCGGGHAPMVVDVKIINQSGEIKMQNETDFMGSMYGHGQGYAGAVFNPECLSPTLTTMQGGNRQPCTIDIKAIDEQNMSVREESFGTLTTDGSSPKHNNRVMEISKMDEIKTVNVKQATKGGSIPCEIGGVADLNYESSTTRRGRVQEGGRICPALATENVPSVLEPWIWEIDGVKYLIRIRKLTPKECYRLMGFAKRNPDGTWDDSAFEAAEKVNSNTQLYKQAGNSIVVDVLENIFKNLLCPNN